MASFIAIMEVNKQGEFIRGLFLKNEAKKAMACLSKLRKEFPDIKFVDKEI